MTESSRDEAQIGAPITCILLATGTLEATKNMSKSRIDSAAYPKEWAVNIP